MIKNTAILLLVILCLFQGWYILTGRPNDGTMRYALVTYLNNSRQIQIALQTFYQDLRQTGESAPTEGIVSRLIEDNYLTRSDLERLLSGRGAYFIYLPSSTDTPTQVSIDFFGEKGDTSITPTSGNLRVRAEQGAAANP